jgi:ATP-binding cassette subfamily G (WHITE) protein 2 (SNQ2)
MLTYNDAIDHQFPYLTVSQTLEFAASPKTPRMRIDNMSRQQYVEGARENRQLKLAIGTHVQGAALLQNQEMDRFESMRSAERASATRLYLPYRLNFEMQFAATFKCAGQRIRSEYAYFLAVTATMLIMPLGIGSMFHQIDSGTSGFFSKGGVIFSIVFFNIIVNFAEILAQFSQQSIVERRHAYSMYHPYIDALATMVSQHPIKIFNIMVFTVIFYFMADLKNEAGPFFLFVVFTFLTTMTMTAWFRVIAAYMSYHDL